MKKKGFSLIELLAVIVILAVLALITIPIISNVIKSAKKQAFKLSVQQVSDNIFFHYNKDWLLEGMNEDKIFDFDTRENLGLLTVQGQLPTSGSISINPRGKISINVNNGVYCAVKTIEQDIIQIGDIVDGVCNITGEEVDTCEYRIGYTWNFDYISTGTDRSQEFSVPCDGNYKLEVWGAQGGSYNSTYYGGYGAYSTGEIELEKDEILYVNVGGQGCAGNNSNICGGYNGGGSANTQSTSDNAGGGGGATHIAYDSGLLKTFSSKQDQLLIVAGGGGGAYYYSDFYASGASAGGISGSVVQNGYCRYRTLTLGTGGSQNSGGTSNKCDLNTGSGSFGQGGNGTAWASGGGSGYYGGGAGYAYGSNGGSSYIGTETLKNKFMYCYNCATSTEESTYTITGKTANSKAVTSSAKKGNGYAKITYLGKNFEESVIACTKGMTWEYNYKTSNGNGVEQSFTPSCTGYYKLEVWGAQGGTVTTSYTGYTGGYGGYATGVIKLEPSSPIYINVGGKGVTASGYDSIAAGGYNGGGSGYTSYEYYRYTASGGGATHMAFASGLLKTFKPNIENSIHDKLIIVAGGGAGTWYTGSPSQWETRVPGYGGGFKGTNSTAIKNGTLVYGTGGSQTSGYAFGQGFNATKDSAYGGAPGGGGGYYGGHGNSFAAAGGSGYIGYNLLYKKSMYCYNCDFSNEISTNTKSTTSINEIPTVNSAKSGNGYAKITYVGETLDTSFNATGGEYWDYNYKSANGSGVEQTFTVPVTGKYRIEVWGAQGGNASTSYIGGYGGYSVGDIDLTKDTTLYINVGGAGTAKTEENIPGGYNGGGSAAGGNCNEDLRTGGSGGGATHIALEPGLLTNFNPTLENSIHDKLIIVAGGGGGGFYLAAAYGSGGSGGGKEGVKSSWTNKANYGHNYYVQPTGGTQTTAGSRGYSYSVASGSASFGKGEDFVGRACGNGSGGGGGYYGGGAGQFAPGSGGSGYIGNNSLSNKHMYCYNCTTSAASNTSTYTISNGTNSCKNSNPQKDCAKLGNGYARITLLEIK